MKKTLVSALTTALVVGAASTTFAAANPFSDVPADHWAYDAVTQLAADGVVEGYGDGTYRGDRNITRYEMAQMIAKAMAKQDVSAKTKALIDKLAAEFSEELNNLGVRVANLEKHADMVQWTGKLEYTYHNFRQKDVFREQSGKLKDTVNGYVFRLEPKAEVNDHWTVNARLDAVGSMNHDMTTDVHLERAWAQGDYNNFQVKLGKFEFNPAQEHGLLWDTEVSGAEMTFGKDLTFALMGGRLADDKVYPGVRWASKYSPSAYQTDVFHDSGEDPGTVFGVRLQYDKGSNFYGGVGFYHIKDGDLKGTKATIDGSTHVISPYSHDGNSTTDKASIWTVNAGYRFNDKANLWANYARNTKADIEKTSWQAEFDYGNYTDRPEKGAWGVYLAYRQFGYNITFQGTMYDDALRGTKGWAVGAKYAPFKNVGLIAKYFNGKTITSHDKVEKLFGRVEFFF